LLWEGYADPSYVEVFEDENHGKVSASYMGSSDELVAKLRGGSAGTCDVISPSSDVAIMIATSNLAARWPLMTNQLRKVSFPVGETIPERRHAGLDRPPHAEGEFLTILGESGSGKTRWALPLGRGHDRLAEVLREKRSRAGKSPRPHGQAIPKRLPGSGWLAILQSKCPDPCHIQP
jgi:hypothetical protein